MSTELAAAPSTDSKISALRTHYVRTAEAWFDHMLSHCESPIEQLFFAEAIHRGWDFPLAGLWTIAYREIGRLAGEPPKTLLVDNPSEAVLCPQLSVGRYRLDFAIFHFELKLAIELDGHDFHERTKLQAERDRSRDRWFTANGWTVIRFTGSEIYRDVSACWHEVDAIIMREIITARRVSGAPVPARNGRESKDSQRLPPATATTFDSMLARAGELEAAGDVNAAKALVRQAMERR